MKMYKVLNLYGIVFVCLMTISLISCEKTLYEEDQPVTDIDGNIYKTVKIGNQVWMAENLKVMKYSDGTPLTLINTQGEWNDISIYTKACIVDEKYGGYYSGAAAINMELYNPAPTEIIQGVCPTGWHLPANSEWEELVNFLGGSEIAGGKLKEAGSAHWKYPNMKATNESGFSAFGGGYKNKSSYMPIPSSFSMHYGYWWSSDLGGLSLAFHNGAAYVSFGNAPSLVGKSVRCLKD